MTDNPYSFVSPFGLNVTEEYQNLPMQWCVILIEDVWSELRPDQELPKDVTQWMHYELTKLNPGVIFDSEVYRWVGWRPEILELLKSRLVVMKI